MIRIPRDATPEVQEAFRQIAAVLDRVMGARNVDWHGRRIINAGQAIEPRDYVTLDQVERIVLQEVEETVGAGGDGGTPIMADPGAVLFAGANGQPTGDVSRLHWNNTTFILTLEGNLQGATWEGYTVPDILAAGKTVSADPSSPVDGDYWIRASGVSPTRTIELRVRDGGATRVLATLTY